jgi:cytochrome c
VRRDPILFLTVLALPALLTSSLAAAADQKQVDRGRGLLESKCGRCHAIGLEDSSKYNKAPPFRVVVKRYPPETLAEALAEGIVAGHPDMPEQVFEPSEIDAIVGYLDSLLARMRK